MISTTTHILVVFVSAASFPACTKAPIPHNILYINTCYLCENGKFGRGMIHTPFSFLVDFIVKE